MTADCVGGITGAVFVTDETVKAWWTESILAVVPFESRIAQTSSVDVVTLCSILTVTMEGALGSIGANRTLFLAPVAAVSRHALTLSCDVVTESSIAA